MQKNVAVRTAALADAERLLEIYAYYVKETAISFEYDVPALEEFQNRMKKTFQNYPYLVVEEDGKIQGYAYAGPFVGRAAYNWSAELTIYLDKDARKRGYGRKLYEAVEQKLKEMGIQNLYACIGYLEEEDEYLNKNSAQFHAHMGFTLAGRFQKCGYKFGRWYDMIWMEKLIGEHMDMETNGIRKMRENEITDVAEIWLDTNLKAHDFIPEEYWTGNYEMVKSMFHQAEMYVYEEKREIQGFVGLQGNGIAGIFVRNEKQSRGIGRRLLEYVKMEKEQLSLEVYQKNERAMQFYQREGFEITREQVDENTGEKEYVMSWEKR